VKRSIEFPVDPAWVRNPTNSPLATMGQRQAAAARTKLCIVTIGIVLTEHFRTPPGAYYQSATNPQANRWTVTLTRISMGTLDPITGGASMKAVQDAIALWCGVKNERDPVWSWVEPIRQEKRAPKWFGVRIELDDLAPGQDRKGVLTNIDGPIWIAKQRIKEARSMQIKKAGRVSSYQPEAAASGASSAARAKADAIFTKLTGQAPMPPRREDECRCDGVLHFKGAVGCELRQPTALDLRDAAERVLGRRVARATPLRHPVYGQCNIEADGEIVLRADPQTSPRSRSQMRNQPDRDPGEERAARDLAPCPRVTCDAEVHEPCDIKTGEAVAYGVHVERAAAAGIQGVASVAWREPAPTNGVRKVAAQKPLPLLPAWVALPWDQRKCPACDGWGDDRKGISRSTACEACNGGANPPPMRLRRDERLDGIDPVPSIEYGVPAEHQARFGPRVTLTRRRHESARTGVCWLYE
jgi:hypothetical protein